MVKGWIKLMVVLLTGAFCVSLPTLQAIKWDAPMGYVWWTVGFHLGAFAISAFLGALIISRQGPRQYWWFVTYVSVYLGIAFSAMRLDRLVISVNDWPYGGNFILPIIGGYLICAQLWRPDFIKSSPTPTSPPMPLQPNL